MGRPTVMTPETIDKLEEVFALGGTDEEACFYAGIGKTTLYRYQEENPDFRERKEALKQTTILKARQTVVRSLDNPDYAFKYLERKKKDEFSLRSELTGPEGELLSPIKIEIVNGNKSDNSVSEELEQQKEDSSQSGVNEKQ